MADAKKDDKTPRFHVTGQYVKDLSFENPGAPATLVGGAAKPTIDVNIDLAAKKVNDTLYEVVLKISSKATAESKNVFLIELEYAGLFTLMNIPEDKLQHILMVDCPFVIFPYARRIISDVTRDGGFPPLMLEPIDFFSMYRAKMEAAAKNSAADKKGKKEAKA